jgi:hypothetical protein
MQVTRHHQRGYEISGTRKRTNRLPLRSMGDEIPGEAKRNNGERDLDS